MLSVLIETKNDAEDLARTLASLVGAAVEGVVREVFVCDAGSTDHTHDVAEHAGCHFLREGGVAAAAARAKSDWLLILEPGARLVPGWPELVLGHMAQNGQKAACFTLAGPARRPFYAWLLSRPRPLTRGLLVSRRQAMAAAMGGADHLVKRMRPVRLKAEILPAG